MSRLKNHQGFSLVELLVAAGLAAFVIGISAVPIIQMKKLENKVEFLSSLDIAHQIALQRARSGRFLKENLGPLTPASAADKCFGGRGVGCLALVKNNAEIGRFPFTKAGAYSATSVITVSVTCPNDTKCTSVNVTVATSQDAGTHNAIAANWEPIPLAASFVVPAAALASRQEIDFSQCAGKVITGINYDTLKAECTAVTGMNTCSNQDSTGPMTTFGGAETAANCQIPISKTCATGLKTVGMIDNQAICAPSEPECVDPLSANCPTSITLPSCGGPNWQPLEDDKCLDETFTQYDMRSPACALAPRAAIGRNINRCAPDSCTLTGTVKWPDATLGPCEATSVNMTAPVGSNGIVANNKPGFYGSLSALCRSNMPAPSTFNVAGATATCSAIVCSGVENNANVSWSAVGLQSPTPGVGIDTAGPTWACGGNLTVTQTPIFGIPAPTAGQLYAEEAQGSARAIASNTAATATGGGITVSCSDPGPVGSPRSGMLKATGISCLAPTPPAGPFCYYSCIDNFVQTIDGRLEPGETSPESCLHNRAMPTKFSMGCNPQNGATCSLTRPNGPTTQVICATVAPPVETCEPVGSSYLWNGVEWQDMGSPNWNMSLIGGNASMPPPTYMDNPHAMGNGVYFYRSPATMRCGLVGAQPPEQCWQANELPVLRGPMNCDTYTVPGFDGVSFKTQDDCIDSARSHPEYHLQCISGGTTPMDKVNIMCRPIDVADASTCSGRVDLTTYTPPDTAASCPAVAPVEGSMLPYGTLLNGVPIGGNASGFPSGQNAKYGGFGPANDGEAARENINTGWCDAGTGPGDCTFHTMNFIHTCHNGVWDCNPTSSCAVAPAAASCPAVAFRACFENSRDFGLLQNTGALPASPVGTIVKRQDTEFTDAICDKINTNLETDCTCQADRTWSCLVNPPVVTTTTVPGCTPPQIMGYRWTVSYMQAPDTVTWDAIGGTSLFAATEAELNTMFWDACNTFVSGMTTKRKCELEREPDRLCGVPSGPASPPTTLPPTPVVNGACGPSSGAAAASAPASGLCSAGTATAVGGSDPFTWTCNGSGGGTNASCATTTSLCWSLDAGFMDPWTRQCTVHGSCSTEGQWGGGKCINSSNGHMEYPTGTNGNRVQCVKASLGVCNTLGAPGPVVNGRCGEDADPSADYMWSPNVPTRLCRSGTPSTVTGASPWFWTCQGENGGSDDSCVVNPNGCSAAVAIWSQQETGNGSCIEAQRSIEGPYPGSRNSGVCPDRNMEYGTAGRGCNASAGLEVEYKCTCP